MLLLLLSISEALAQDASAAASYAAPAGGLLGGGAAIAYVVERTLRKGDVAADDLTTIKTQLKELHDWHSKEDEDGVKVWYVRKSLGDAIENLGKAVVAFQHAQERQTETLADIAKLIDRVDRRLVETDKE